MMLVAGILAVIGLTITSTFAGGLNIFYRMEKYSTTKADVLISMERLERDLHNAFYYNGIDFIGEPKKVTFAGIIKTKTDKGIAEESLGAISYYRDDSKLTRTLSREEKKYSMAVKNKEAGKGAVTALSPIEDINFKYFSYDPEAESYSWVDSWDKSEERLDRKDEGKSGAGKIALKDMPEDIPLGVKISMSYKDDGKVITLSRVMFIRPAVSLNLAKIKAKLEKEGKGG
jgi:hypothetical protein